MRRLAIRILAGAALAIAAAAPAGAVTTWTAVPSPSPGTGIFNAVFTSVSAVSATDAWAVGNDDSPCGMAPATRAPTAAATCKLHTLAEHWDGVSWSVVPTPDRAGSGNSLNGVVAIATNDVWAVGQTDKAAKGITVTLAEHWDGQSWSIVRTRNVLKTFGGVSYLTSVDAVATDDVWAAGYAITDAGGIELLFEHWNGLRWKKVPSPSPAGAFQFAKAISMSSSTDAWAVGVDESRSPSRNVSAHWDGTAWSIVATPNLEDGMPPDNQLLGVTAIAPDDAWAVGWENNLQGLNIQETIAMHWDGSAWTIVTTPNPNTSGSELLAVASFSSTDVWAVGESKDFDTGSQTSLTMRWNGASWTVVPSPSGFFTTVLHGAATVPGGTAWGVGATEVQGTCCLRTFVIQTSNG